VSTSRMLRVDNWCHLFVDSNAGALRDTGDGHLVDPELYEDRLHINGTLGARETAWIREQVAATDAEHVFIWLHHPPQQTGPQGSAPLVADDGYAAEWQALLSDLPTVRGLGAGHSHVPAAYELDGVPVFMAPSFKNNFDLQAKTLLPPGYRTYEFGDDGSVKSENRFVDEDRWPRHPYGRAVHSLMMAEITFDEFNEIAARKTAT